MKSETLSNLISTGQIDFQTFQESILYMVKYTNGVKIDLDKLGTKQKPYLMQALQLILETERVASYIKRPLQYINKNRNLFFDFNEQEHIEQLMNCQKYNSDLLKLVVIESCKQESKLKPLLNPIYSIVCQAHII